MSVFLATPELADLTPDQRQKLNLAQSVTAQDPKIVIGWREWLTLPDIGIHRIKAKVDTGARTSCLHTHDYEIFDKGDEKWVRFSLYPLKRDPQAHVECELPVCDFREVKDSGGHAENRPFVRTRVLLGGIEWDIELSLSNRESMKFRMLLGRVALRGRFLVDSCGSYLTGKPARVASA